MHNVFYYYFVNHRQSTAFEFRSYVALTQDDVSRINSDDCRGKWIYDDEARLRMFIMFCDGMYDSTARAIILTNRFDGFMQHAREEADVALSQRILVGYKVINFVDITTIDLLRTRKRHHDPLTAKWTYKKCVI